MKYRQHIVFFSCLLLLVGCKRTFVCDCTTTVINNTKRNDSIISTTFTNEQSLTFQARTFAEGQDICFGNYAYLPDTTIINSENQSIRSSTCSIQ